MTADNVFLIGSYFALGAGTALFVVFALSGAWELLGL